MAPKLVVFRHELTLSLHTRRGVRERGEERRNERERSLCSESFLVLCCDGGGGNGIEGVCPSRCRKCASERVWVDTKAKLFSVVRDLSLAHSTSASKPGARPRVSERAGRL